jgi:acyl carrier protein
MSTTLDRLRLLLVKDYKLDPAALLPDAPLDELGIDSLGVAELMFNVEDEFRIAIPGEPVVLKTVGDVAAYIDGLIAAQHADAAPGNAATLRTAPGR